MWKQEGTMCANKVYDTITKLRNRPAWLTLTQIAEDTGLCICWLSRLQKGKHAKKLDYTQIQTLANYMEKVC